MIFRLPCRRCMDSAWRALLLFGAALNSYGQAPGPVLSVPADCELGRQCMVLSMQVKRVEKTASIPSGYEIAIDGARTFTGMDAVEWARRGQDLGAGEIVVNSIDRDGTGAGYDLEITGLITQAVSLPVIASGGAGLVSHVSDAFAIGATGAIVSSMLYSPRLEHNLSVEEMKEQLAERGDRVRPVHSA